MSVDLSDVDRGVYETLDLRVAQHPSETTAFMLVRVLAYCLEYEDGIVLTPGGVSAADTPAVAVYDLTGRMTKWVDVGLPDAERLHRASKRAGRVAVYTHRDVRQLLAQLEGQTIHHAAQVRIRALDRQPIEDAAGRLDRRTSFALSVGDGEVHLSFDAQTIGLPIRDYRLQQR